MRESQIEWIEDVACEKFNYVSVREPFRFEKIDMCPTHTNRGIALSRSEMRIKAINMASPLGAGDVLDEGLIPVYIDLIDPSDLDLVVFSLHEIKNYQLKTWKAVGLSQLDIEDTDEESVIDEEFEDPDWKFNEEETKAFKKLLEIPSKEIEPTIFAGIDLLSDDIILELDLRKKSEE